MSSAKSSKNRSHSKILILACSGASNLGQLANQAAMELVEENFGQMLCTSAVGARVRSAVELVRQASIVLTINGCDSHCVNRILKDLGRTDIRPVTVTELGIDRRPGFFSPTDEVERVKEAVRRALVGE